MNFEFFIGIDVSKSELDFAVMHGKDQLFHREIVNTPEEVIEILNSNVYLDVDALRDRAKKYSVDDTTLMKIIKAHPTF